MKIVSQSVVKKLATWPLVFSSTRTALVAAAVGDGVIFDVVRGRGSQPGCGFGAKSGMLKAERSVVGIKVGSYWEPNRARGLAAHGSTTLLLDDDTGFPHALVNAQYLNKMRTAAANAVAVDLLASKGASVLTVFGAGHQALYEVQAVRQVRPVTHINIINRSLEGAQAMVKLLTESAYASDGQCALESCVAVDAADASAVANAVQSSDLITTVTLRRTEDGPVFPASAVRGGTHISAMGSDAVGKGELDIVELAKREHVELVADHPPQSFQFGEFQHLPVEDQARVTAIGDLLRGAHTASTSQNSITVFDSSGIALQDLTAAAAVLAKAEQEGLVQTVDF